MRYVAARSLAPGVVCRDVIYTWVGSPLWLLRPTDGPMEDRRPRLEADANPAPFSADEETIVAAAKKRPVLVVAGLWELRARGGVRVLPIHSRSDKPFYASRWPEIVAGEVAGLIHMPSDPTFGFVEGVLDLTAGHRVPRSFMPDTPWFALDRGSVEGVQAAMERLTRLLLPPRGG